MEQNIRTNRVIVDMRGKKLTREISAYLMIGIVTTVVNWSVYVLATRLFHVDIIFANFISWIVAVIFAYLANRVVVFQSRDKGIIRECIIFVWSRVFSMFLEMALIWSSVYLFAIGDIESKIIVSAIVIVVNYITGKVFVFSKREKVLFSE